MTWAATSWTKNIWVKFIDKQINSSLWSSVASRKNTTPAGENKTTDFPLMVTILPHVLINKTLLPHVHINNSKHPRPILISERVVHIVTICHARHQCWHIWKKKCVRTLGANQRAWMEDMPYLQHCCCNKALLLPPHPNTSLSATHLKRKKKQHVSSVRIVHIYFVFLCIFADCIYL